ncbi:MAG: N-acetylmuramoyl-L-alanine amidase [bacterium]
MRDIKRIILHCSDSRGGDKHLIDDWHKRRGFKKIGYHFVICNGYSDPANWIYNPKLDGLLQPGRSVNEVGAHCVGYNDDSIGICLIGQRLFSAKQLLESLQDLLVELMLQFELEPKDIYGHYELTSNKTCPNINMDMVRRMFV